MHIFNLLFGGLVSIFGGTTQRSINIDTLRSRIEEYKTIPDKKRLANDWYAVSVDMSKAWQRIISSYGQE